MPTLSEVIDKLDRLTINYDELIKINFDLFYNNIAKDVEFLYIGNDGDTTTILRPNIAKIIEEIKSQISYWKPDGISLVLSPDNILSVVNYENIQFKNEKNQPNGYCGLNSEAKIDILLLPIDNTSIIANENNNLSVNVEYLQNIYESYFDTKYALKSHTHNISEINEFSNLETKANTLIGVNEEGNNIEFINYIIIDGGIY